MGKYDRARELVIDPVIELSTYLGGSDQDSGNAIAAGADGSLYVAGTTRSTDFPGFDPAQPRNAGGTDAYVAHLMQGRHGWSLDYVTYYGGSGDEDGRAIALGATTQAGTHIVYLAGATSSPDLPTTPNAFNRGLSDDTPGQTDAFAAVLDARGRLLYGTYLGGSANDTGNGIAVDNSGDMFITGTTESAVFPVQGPMLPAGPVTRPQTAFLAEIANPLLPPTPSATPGRNLVLQLLLTDTGSSTGNGVTVERTGDTAYVTGGVLGATAPAQPSALGIPLPTTATEPNQDAFLAIVKPRNGMLASWDTFGGSEADTGTCITVDDHAIYIGGVTASMSDFPANSVQLVPGGGVDGFVARIPFPTTSSTPSQPGPTFLATCIGGSGNDMISGIAILKDSVYYVGTTTSPDLPTLNPLQEWLGAAGKSDALVGRLDVITDNWALGFQSYFGGQNDDSGNGIAVPPSASNSPDTRVCCITGDTVSPAGHTDPLHRTFPVTGVLQPNLASEGQPDAFVAVIGDTPDAGKLVVSPRQLSFPGATVGDPASSVKQLRLTNHGPAALEVVVGNPVGPFYLPEVASAGKLVLFPGESKLLKVHFRPTSAQRFRSILTLSSNGVSGRLVKVVLTGTGHRP